MFSHSQHPGPDENPLRHKESICPFAARVAVDPDSFAFHHDLDGFRSPPSIEPQLREPEASSRAVDEPGVERT
ncbi:MAG TPA: hypothetical protein VOA00_06115, partial [Thermoanaerobaculia bacterium]|nr:hypothetical protein [Thermoanaerobaculia bacterium]